jgi:putative transposase
MSEMGLQSDRYAKLTMVVGWSVDRTLQSKLSLNASQKAIANRQPPAGLIHHSDRGVQYACEGYIRVLRDHQMMPSMSRPSWNQKKP